jgi:glycosyltransferase involved in cell wall biosynthesis
MPTILCIGHVWPEPASSAAGARTLGLLRLFRQQGWKTHFACAAAPTAHTADLSDEAEASHAIRLNDASFDGFIRDLCPDLVLFDRFMTEEQYGWRVSEHCPLALRVLDTIDLHCLRQARHEAFKAHRGMTLDDLQSDTAKREIAAILRSDLSLVVSDYEYDLLRRDFRIDAALLHYLPLMVTPLASEGAVGRPPLTTPTVSPVVPPFEARDGFVFIGNFLHEPNADAVRHLHRDIWPALRRRLPSAQLRIYGAYAPEWAKQMHKPAAGFHVLGRADDALSVLAQARLCLAPLRFGAGVKGKLIDAMLAGTPSVTTSVGAEGLQDPAMPWCGAVVEVSGEGAADGATDSTDAFADAAFALFQDPAAWHAAQQRGFDLIQKRHADPRFEADFLQTCEALLRDIPGHRRRHFLGALLHHHTVQSTRFKSKWIELKNQSSPQKPQAPQSPRAV